MWRECFLDRGFQFVTCLVLCTMPACERAGPELDDGQTKTPLISIYWSSGYRIIEDQRYRSGLIVAVWSDGRILRAESERAVGVTYVEGKLTQEQLRQAIKRIRGSRGICAPQVPLTLDAPYETIILRTKTGCMKRMHNYTNPYDSSSYVAALAEIRKLLWGFHLESAKTVPWSKCRDDVDSTAFF